MVIAQVWMFPIYFCELKSIEMYQFLAGVSVRDFHGTWDPCKGVTSRLSTYGMDSSITGWAGGISPSSRMLGWLRRSSLRWIQLVLFNL